MPKSVKPESNSRGRLGTAAQAPTNTAGAETTRCRRILLVEDEEPFRELIQAFLREQGFEVHAVGNGRCGVQWLAGNAVDLVITDLCMPDTDGIELLMTLRKIRSAVPIIVMSGGVAGDIAAMLRAATLLGARWALAKPFALQELSMAVREVLR